VSQGRVPLSQPKVRKILDTTRPFVADALAPRMKREKLKALLQEGVAVATRTDAMRLRPRLSCD
jgi:hypothetical protein